MKKYLDYKDPRPAIEVIEEAGYTVGRKNSVHAREIIRNSDGKSFGFCLPTKAFDIINSEIRKRSS